MFLIAVVIVGIGLYYLGPSITGLVIKQYSYTEETSLVVTADGNYTWELANEGELKSLKIDGSVTKSGKARAYLQHANGTRYLIFDSTKTGEGKETVNKSNESNLITAFAVKEDDAGKNESDEDKRKKNHKPDWISGIDEFTVNGTKTINLSQHFTDEDNDTLIYSVSEVDHVETTISNETITITINSNESFNTTMTFTASDGIDAKSETVSLIVLAEESAVINSAPLWNSSIDAFLVNGSTTIDLSQYFIDEDNDTLTYTAGLVENMSVGIDNSLVTLVPAENYSGNTSASFVAYDGKNSTIKIVTLIVPEKIVLNITEPMNDTNQTINETNQTITNETINKTITINLAYKAGTIYDANDNGEESVNGIIDLSIENTRFSWNANESKLCTRWEVYNTEKEQLTTFCNGNADCCAFFELLPTKSNWSEIYYSVFGKDGAGYDNIVSAQVLYYDVNLSIDNLKSDIYYSEWSNKSVKFFEDEIEFFGECIETCALSGLNHSDYILVFEIEEDAVLRIDKISYDVLVDVANSPPVLLKNFSIVNMPKNKNATINLSEYFADSDGDKLTYWYYKPDNITIFFESDAATIVPDKGIEGISYTYLVANDSENIAASNLFIINVSEEPLPVELKFFEIRDNSDRKLAVFDSFGNLNIKGVLIQNTEPVADENDFVIQDSFGNISAVVKNPDGDLMIRGNLVEQQQALTPTPNSFIIQNQRSDTVAYFNSTGSLLLKGILREGFLFE